MVVWCSHLQAWITERCWSRSSGATGCRVLRTAPRRCTSWWCNAGRRTLRRGPPLSTCRPFWRTTSLPLSLSTSRGIISEQPRPSSHVTPPWPPPEGAISCIFSHPLAEKNKIIDWLLDLQGGCSSNRLTIKSMLLGMGRQTWLRVPNSCNEWRRSVV